MAGLLAVNAEFLRNLASLVYADLAPRLKANGADGAAGAEAYAIFSNHACVKRPECSKTSRLAICRGNRRGGDIVLMANQICSQICIFPIKSMIAIEGYAV